MSNLLEKKAEKERLPFYSFRRVLSYNGVYVFVIGGRGLGKTFGAKENAVKDAIYKGKQFIYLRRYAKELSKARATFMADLRAKGKFPNHDFRITGYTLEFAHISTAKDKKREWKVAGYFQALSTTQGEKSTAFPYVYTIIFDEFIIEKGMIRYIPDEATALTNFYNTVDRYEDRVKVLFLANSVSIDNPYFIEYGIEPKAEDEFIQLMDGFIVCHFPDSQEFKDEVFKTRFGKFIAETEYADYAVGNGFKDNHDNLLQIKGSDANYAFTLETNKGIFSIWKDYTMRTWYIQERRPKSEIVFTLLPEKMKTGKTLLFKNDTLIQQLRTSFRQGKVNFDKPKSRNAFIDIFSR